MISYVLSVLERIFVVAVTSEWAFAILNEWFLTDVQVQKETVFQKHGIPAESVW